MRCIVFIDGQNLYHRAKDAWGSRELPEYSWPSYDVEKLARVLVNSVGGRTLAEIRFYTGVPNPRSGSKQRFWHGFWSSKTRLMLNQGIYVYWGRINIGGQEKGVDVSLSIDLIQATHERRYETAIIVSQDSDFGPAVRLAKQIARDQGRMLAFESAFPVGSGSQSHRGVPGTTWRPIDKSTYDACQDPPGLPPQENHLRLAPVSSRRRRRSLPQPVANVGLNHLQCVEVPLGNEKQSRPRPAHAGGASRCGGRTPPGCRACRS